MIAVFYSLFVAASIYRTISFADFFEILVDSAVTSSVIMFIVVFAGIFSWGVSVTGIIDKSTNSFISIASNPLALLLLVNLLLIFLGLFIDAISIC